MKCSVFLIVGFVGNGKVNTGLHSMINAVIDTGSSLLDQAQNIGEKLAGLEYTKDAGKQIEDLVNTANDILDQGKDLRTTINGYNDKRYVL